MGDIRLQLEQNMEASMAALDETENDDGKVEIGRPVRKKTQSTRLK